VQKTAGIYVHIPFCARKCTYCNFNTTDYFEDLAARYIDAVSREIYFWGRNLRRTAIDTIYFGGGTPSLVSAEQVARLVKSCREAFDVAADAEITIEINPATFSREKIEGWLAGGINRASVGVQSFIDEELESLSRVHTSEDARRTINGLRAAGFDNLSVDLIAGLPEQSTADWGFNLREAIALRPEHMSLYLLEVKEGTQLYSQLRRGLRPAPDDDAAAEMYQMICAATRAAGYEHYEISNFALLANRGAAGDRPISPFRSKHNVKYWTGAPFYGMGCGAHSYDMRARWTNIMQAEKYISSVEWTGQAVAERRELTAEDRAAEAIFMGLRLREGITLDEFREDYGVDVLERAGDQLPRLGEAG
jgi:oxygen-independent coproporphyrinogen-3 oxidase